MRIAIVENDYTWPSPPGANGKRHFRGALLDMVPDVT